MSNHTVEVTPQQAASDKEFLKKMKDSDKAVYIQRQTIQARITHDVTVICCILLIISGLFVFIPPLAAAIGGQAVFAIRMSHRIIGLIFILFPLASALIRPKAAVHKIKELFVKWDSDDKKWMMLFFPYLFMAKWIHMPDQGHSKSGQRFADGMLWLLCLVMAITGVLLILATSVFDWGATARGVILFLHDLGFFGICVFGMAHIFLGAGIFQPYRGSGKIMFGDGTVSESDALYHWGHWARKELTEGENIVLKPKADAK